MLIKQMIQQEEKKRDDSIVINDMDKERSILEMKTRKEKINEKNIFNCNETK